MGRQNIMNTLVAGIPQIKCVLKSLLSFPNTELTSFSNDLQWDMAMHLVSSVLVYRLSSLLACNIMNVCFPLVLMFHH